jgi:hypothetical protein
MAPSATKTRMSLPSLSLMKSWAIQSSGRGCGRGHPLPGLPFLPARSIADDGQAPPHHAAAGLQHQGQASRQLVQWKSGRIGRRMGIPQAGEEFRIAALSRARDHAPSLWTMRPAAAAHARRRPSSATPRRRTAPSPRQEGIARSVHLDPDFDSQGGGRLPKAAYRVEIPEP